jgi:hypothetical protein
LISLDISKNVAVERLICNNNVLTNLDFSNNKALTHLYCYSNSFFSLDLSKNTALAYLHCSSNFIPRLDFSQNTNLQQLYCTSNLIETLDVSKNSVLNELSCGTNQIKNLDVSKNTALAFLNCTSNQLTTLNIKNGFNTKITSFDATGNPNLKCIEADKTTPPYSSWRKDATAIYSITSCTLSNNTSEKNINSVLVFPNPTNDILNIVLPADLKLKKAEVFSLTGQKVAKTTQSQISLKHLAKGEYLLIIETNGGQSTKKVIKN